MRGAAAGFVLGAALVGFAWWFSGGRDDDVAGPRHADSDIAPRRGTNAARPDEPAHRRAVPRAAVAAEPDEPKPEPVPDFPDDVRLTISQRFQSAPPVASQASANEIARAAGAAQRWTAAHPGVPKHDKVEAMLADADGDTVAAAIQFAWDDRDIPLLIKAARDDTLGSLRLAALDAAVTVAPHDPAVVALLSDTARGRDIATATRAQQLLPDVGVPPLDEAIRRSREGGMDASAITQIAVRAIEQKRAAEILRDASLPAALERELLARLPATWVDDEDVRLLITWMTDNAPDAAVREEARRRLQETHPGDGRGIVILSAIYGIDTRLLDVTDEVRGRLTRGRAVFMVWSDLGGDPAVGVTKTLTVEFTFAGRRFTRTAQDAGWLTIP